jgi:hypothetical protein
VKETKTITLDAGSFLNKVEIKYSFTPAQLSVATGIAIIPGNGGKEWTDLNKNSILAYEQPAQANGTITLGMIVPQKCTTAQVTTTGKDTYDHSGQYLLQTIIKKNSPLTYYQGASWSKEGSFKNFDDWKQYLLNKTAALQNPLNIQLKK